MNPVQNVLRQGQYFKRKGIGSSLAYDGAYTSELFTFANVAAGTDVGIIAPIAGSKIRIISLMLSGGAAGVSTITFTSDPAVGAGTAITSLISLAANGTYVAQAVTGLFQTLVVADGLSATVTGATMGVTLSYILVD